VLLSFPTAPDEACAGRIAGAKNPGNPDRNSTETCRVNHTSRTGEMNMSAKIAFAALAAFLTALTVAGTASARGFSPSAQDLRSDPAFNRLHGSRAFGSVNVPASTSFGRSSNDVVFSGRNLGRDPDPNVRLELLRDYNLGRN
jgi:hypothetical protein